MIKSENRIKNIKPENLVRFPVFKTLEVESNLPFKTVLLNRKPNAKNRKPHKTTNQTNSFFAKTELPTAK